MARGNGGGGAHGFSPWGEREHHRFAPTAVRARQFVGMLLWGALGPWAIGNVLWIWKWLRPEALWIIIVLALFSVAGLTFVAYRTARDYAKQTVFIGWHAVSTVVVIVLLVLAPVMLGPGHGDSFDGYGALWIDMSMVQAIVGAVTMTSWLFLRVDVFRADGKRNPWGSVRMEAYTPELDQVTREGPQTRIPVTIGEGGSLTELQTQVLPALEEAGGFVRRAGYIDEGDGHGGAATVVLQNTPPFERWLDWPGFSAPGASFGGPDLVTAYFDHTGGPAPYRFAADLARAKAAVAWARTGFSQVGKSGEHMVLEAGEVLSRYDTHLVQVNLSKFEMNCGWARPFLSAVVDHPDKLKVLMPALADLITVREQILAAAGFHQWGEGVYEATGIAALVIQIDEMDEAFVASDALRDIATRGLAVGIFLSVSIPRPSADSGKNMQVIRQSFKGWKIFQTENRTMTALVVDEGLIKAGVTPHHFPDNPVGAHYNVGNPVLAQRLWTVALRSYRLADWSVLVQRLHEVRATFPTPTWHEKELEIIGEALKMCDPSLPPATAARRTRTKTAAKEEKAAAARLKNGGEQEKPPEPAKPAEPEVASKPEPEPEPEPLDFPAIRAAYRAAMEVDPPGTLRYPVGVREPGDPRNLAWAEALCDLLERYPDGQEWRTKELAKKLCPASYDARPDAAAGQWDRAKLTIALKAAVKGDILLPDRVVAMDCPGHGRYRFIVAPR